MCIAQSPNGYKQSFKMGARPSEVQDRAKGENKSGEWQVPAGDAGQASLNTEL